MGNSYNVDKSTLIILGIFIVLTIVLYKFNSKEGFYLSYFPPNSKDARTTIMDNKDVKATSIIYKNKKIIFRFPQETSRENMIVYIANFFKSKIGGIYENVINIFIERNGLGNGEFEPQSSRTDLENRITNKDYDKVFLIIGYVQKDNYKNSAYGTSNRTKYITTPQTNKYERIPIEFTNNLASILLDKKKTPRPIMYFMHYWFDTFYCRGNYEKKLNIVGFNQKDVKNENIHKYIVEVGDVQDCKWGSDSSKVQTCKIGNDKELEPDTISVEPDSDARSRGYKTPFNNLDKCRVKEIYFKKWDGRGVPIDKIKQNVEMKEFIYHPGLVQNKLDGLYDDVFDMSRIIPSFPTGRAVSGR